MKRALLGLLLVLVGPAAVIPFLDVAWVRMSGAPGFAVQAVGIWLAATAVPRNPGRRGVRVVCGLCVMIAVVFAYLWWFGARLPEADRFASLPEAPPIATADVDGVPRSLADATRDAPLLLVFFRGHW